MVLYPGAHIATGESEGTFHHGIVIDTSGEMTIVHFWGEKKQDARIQTTTLNTFLAGHPNLVGKKTRPLYLINYTDDTEQKRQDTVHNARVLLTQADQHMYNILNSNCECFACFCRTGRWVSAQVERVKQLLARELHGLVQQSVPSVGHVSTGSIVQSLSGTIALSGPTTNAARARPNPTEQRYQMN